MLLHARSVMLCAGHWLSLARWQGATDNSKAISRALSSLIRDPYAEYDIASLFMVSFYCFVTKQGAALASPTLHACGKPGLLAHAHSLLTINSDAMSYSVFMSLHLL